MKILVTSDTHGDINPILRYVREVDGDFNKIIHLGDYCKDAREIEFQTEIETIRVRGNGDFTEFDEENEKIIELGEKRLFLTHGHKYGVKRDLNRIYYKALSVNADIAMFGHTHVRFDMEYDGILIINPGSPTIPRGKEGPSMLVLNIGSGQVEKNIIHLKKVLT